MYAIKTARIKSDELIQMKRRKKLQVIRDKLESAGVEFETDLVGKIKVKPPYEIFRCVKTNDIVVMQGNF